MNQTYKQRFSSHNQQDNSFIQRKLKSCAIFLGLLRALPALLTYKVGKLFVDKNRAFSLATENVAKIPGMIGIYARYAFYKQTLAHVGKDVCFGFMSTISKTETHIGDRVYIGRNCSLGLVKIKDDVMLSDAVQIISGRHQHGSTATEAKVLRDNTQQFKRIILGHGCWIGTDAIVMNHVGRHAIVGAGSVVVKSVRVRDKVAGTPAQSIKQKQENILKMNHSKKSSSSDSLIEAA